MAVLAEVLVGQEFVRTEKSVRVGMISALAKFCSALSVSTANLHLNIAGRSVLELFHLAGLLSLDFGEELVGFCPVPVGETLASVCVARLEGLL
jgi:hypothetical protein